MIENKKISKILTKTDTGESGSHQSGPGITKKFIDFFPDLPSVQKKNPHKEIDFKGRDKTWTLKFIYYNNKFFGGTRNEHRLTLIKKYYKKYDLKSGDELILSKKDGIYYIDHNKNNGEKTESSEVIKLSNKWRKIKL